MSFSRSDLADLAYFVVIARKRSFRAASDEIGVSASALSHAMRGLETRLGVRLLNRTNRSVTLTAAGEELLGSILEPFAQLDLASDVLNRFRETPRGRVRLNVPGDAAQYLFAPVLPSFFRKYPDIHVEIGVSNRLIDVIERGYDAGVRFGGTVPEDMIAQRVSGDIRWVVAGAPVYLAQYGVPDHPQDLFKHQALQIRLGSGGIYQWEFERGDETVTLNPPGPTVIDETNYAVALALAGAGLIYAPEFAVAHHLETGALREVLKDWASMGDGFHVYYSSRRQVPAGLRLLIEHLRELRPLGL